MPPLTCSGYVYFLVLLLLLPTTIGACDRTQAVSLTAEDFRFTPEVVATAKRTGAGMMLEPGQSIRLIPTPPAGTYPYMCRRKGHANMTGTMLVDRVRKSVSNGTSGEGLMRVRRTQHERGCPPKDLTSGGKNTDGFPPRSWK